MNAGRPRRPTPPREPRTDIREDRLSSEFRVYSSLTRQTEDSVEVEGLGLA